MDIQLPINEDSTSPQESTPLDREPIDRKLRRQFAVLNSFISRDKAEQEAIEQEDKAIEKLNSLWATKLLRSLYYLFGLSVITYLDRNYGPYGFLSTCFLSCVFTDFLVVHLMNWLRPTPYNVEFKSWAYMLTYIIRNVGYFAFFYDRLQRRPLDFWETFLFFTIRPSN